MFITEQDCIDYFVNIRWSKGFECPVCGSIRLWKKVKGRFECIDCHTETTVTNGTIFHKSTKPWMVWFRAPSGGWLHKKMELVLKDCRKYSDSVVIELLGHGFINFAE